MESEIQTLRKQLEEAVRWKREIKGEKAEANEGFNKEIKEAEKREDQILSEIDKLKNPPPQQDMSFGD